MKKTKPIRHKTIRISSRTYDLIFDPQRDGGQFSSMADDGKKRGQIIVGTRCDNPQHLLEILLHEIIEATLAINNRRWKDETNDLSPMIFCFDHNYLDEFVAKILDSLISSGMLDMGEKTCC